MNTDYLLGYRQAQLDIMNLILDDIENSSFMSSEDKRLSKIAKLKPGSTDTGGRVDHTSPLVQDFTLAEPPKRPYPMSASEDPSP